MTRVIINLQKNELSALVNLAEQEYRDTRQQAALIICQELERRGLLVIQDLDASPIAGVALNPTNKKAKTIETA